MNTLKVHLKWTNWIKVGEKIYFSNNAFNGLFCLDINDFSVQFIHKFESVDLAQIGMASMEGIIDGDWIYFLPNHMNFIVGYNLSEGKEQVIPIPGFAGDIFKIVSAIQRDYYVYMIPTELKYGIYVFDIRNHKVFKDNTLSDLFETEAICIRAFESDDDSVLIFLKNTNQVMKVNLITKHMECIKCFDENIKIYCVCYGNSSYWILPMNSTDIYEWNMEKDTVSVHENKCYTDVVSEGPLYSNLVFLEDETLVLNCRLEKIMRINRVTGAIDNPMDYPEGFKLVNCKFEWWPIFSQYIISGNKVLLFPCRGNMLLVYDIETGTMHGKEMAVTKNEVPYLNREMGELVISKDISYENDKRTSLVNFITYICSE